LLPAACALVQPVLRKDAIVLMLDFVIPENARAVCSAARAWAKVVFHVWAATFPNKEKHDIKASGAHYTPRGKD
jgi:hypothetical protein